MEPVILNHPFVSTQLSIIRNKDTKTKEFREAISQLAMFLCYESMRNAETEDISVETPLTITKCKKINDDKYVFVPILRAGLGMVDGIVKVFPTAKIGHIGLCRNEETLEPEKYYFKLPKDIQSKNVIIIDPMLATGGSACDAIKMIKEEGVKNIKFLCIIAAPEGLKKVHETHPDVEIYSASLDDHLNEKGYIVPGLGDAGDRIFGTI